MTIKKLIDKRLQRYTVTPPKQSGFLGRTDGVIRVPGKRNWFYVTLYDGTTIQAFNRGNVPASYKLAVTVIFENQTHYIEARQVYGTQVFTGIPDGLASEMQWPGTATLYVRPEQYLPGLVYPKSGLTVTLYGAKKQVSGGGYALIPTQDIDLAPYIPASGAHWGVIALQDDGTVAVTTGGAALLWAALDPADIPTTAGFAVAAIRLFAGQTSIQHGKFGSMIEDLRWFQAGGGGSISLPASRLIATNSGGLPVTNSPVWDTDGQIRWSDNPSFSFPTALLGWLIAGENTTPGISLIRASDNNRAGAFNFVKYGGTLTSPSAVQSGWRLGSFSFGGHFGSGIDSLKARISAVATQVWSAINRGTKVVISVTPTNTDTMQDVAEFAGDRIDLLQPAYAPTASVGNNSTQIATTEFVNTEIDNDRPYSNANPLMNGTPAQGTSTRISRQDHIHPTDTSRQAANANLTAIAGLTPTDNDVIQRKAGVWTSSTMAQLRVDLDPTAGSRKPFRVDGINTLGFNTVANPYVPPSPFSAVKPAANHTFSTSNGLLNMRNWDSTSPLYLRWTSATAITQILATVSLSPTAYAIDTHLFEIRGWAVQNPGASDRYWSIKWSWLGASRPQYPLCVSQYSGTGIALTLADGTASGLLVPSPIGMPLLPYLRISGGTTFADIWQVGGSPFYSISTAGGGGLPASFREVWFLMAAGANYHQIFIDDVHLV